MTAAELRRRALAEWRGYAEPPPTVSRVTPVADLVAKTMHGLGLRDRVRESEVLQAWQEIVGEFIAQHSTPQRLREGVLFVRVLQPSIHFELERVWKAQILERLRRRFGTRTIREVRFRIG